MKICPDCESPHSKNGIFCSQACAARSAGRSVVWTDELRRLRGEQTRTGILKGGLETRLKLSIAAKKPENILKRAEAARRRHEETYTNTRFEELSDERRKRRVVEEQEGKCFSCGLKDWEGETLILEIDHIDGNVANNQRDNVRALCPNCHSLTPTWRGRNKRKHATDEEICKALLSTTNIRQALLKLGMAAKGGNYARLKPLRDKLFSGGSGEIQTHGEVSLSV